MAATKKKRTETCTSKSTQRSTAGIILGAALIVSAVLPLSAHAENVYVQPTSGLTVERIFSTSLSGSAVRSETFIATSTQSFVTAGHFQSLVSVPTGKAAIFCVYDETTSTQIACTPAYAGIDIQQYIQLPMIGSGNEGSTLIVGNTYSIVGISTTVQFTGLVSENSLADWYVLVADSGGSNAVVGDIDFPFRLTSTSTLENQWNNMIADIDSSQACEDATGAIGYSTCKVFAYLFTPRAQTLTDFTDFFSTISSKPPFGYYGAMKDAFSTISSSTAATSSSSYVVAAAAAAPIIYGSFFDDWNFYLSMILYLLLGIYVLLRIAHFDFHS